MLTRQNFRAIFKASPHPYLILRPDPPRFTIVEANAAYLRATRTREEDLLGRGLFEAFPENPAEPDGTGTDPLRASLEQALTTGAPHGLEVNRYDIPIRGEDKFEVRYWSPENIPVLNDQGEVEFIIHTAPDITGRVQAEKQAATASQQLRQHRQHFRSLFEHNPDAIYSFDRQGNFLSANPATARLTETSVEELLEVTFLPFIAAEDRERVFDHFLRAAEGQVRHYECGLVTARGNRKTIKVTNMPIKVGGKIVGVYGIAKDVTEQRMRLEKEQQLLRTIIDNLPDFIYVKDRRRRLVVANKRLYDCMFNAEKEEEILGMTAYDLFDPATARPIDKDDRRVIEQGEPIHDRLESACDHQGNRLWLLTTKLPLRDPDGEITGLVGVTRDITQLKQQEEKLRASLQEKEVLLGEVHHRVKNNLAVISGLLQLQGMQANSEELARLLSDSEMRIKSIALIHEKLYEAERLSEVEFGSYVQGLAASIGQIYDPEGRVRLQVSGGAMRLNINQAVPAALILNELLLNAFEHGLGGELGGTIAVDIEAEGGRTRVQVRDSGRGLPEGFDWERQESMGLTIVQTLVKQLQADMAIGNSEEGSGAVARFSFQQQELKGSSSALTEEMI